VLISSLFSSPGSVGIIPLMEWLIRSLPHLQFFEARTRRANTIVASHQIGGSPPPAAPAQSGPGPSLRPTSAGFDIEAHPPPDAERSASGQFALHRRLKRHAERLQSAIVRISSTHSLLADEFGDHTLFLFGDLADLDVASLWSIGTGLSEQVSALTLAGPGVMTPGR
jgi:hypothetical protein